MLVTQDATSEHCSILSRKVSTAVYLQRYIGMVLLLEADFKASARLVRARDRDQQSFQIAGRVLLLGLRGPCPKVVASWHNDSGYNLLGDIARP